MPKWRNLSQLKEQNLKEQNKAMARHETKTEVTSLMGEFKAKTIRILTGLEKRKDDISETLTIDIKVLKKKNQR